MASVLLFKKIPWNVASVTAYLGENTFSYELRSGFSHILAVSEALLGPEGLCLPENEIICVLYDRRGSEESWVSSAALILTPTGTRSVPIHELLAAENNVKFDLFNFGYPLKGRALIDDIFKSLQATAPIPDFNAMRSYACSDIMSDLGVPEVVKRRLLELYAMVMAEVRTLSRLNGQDLLSQYSASLALTLVVRAKIEKLMLLIAELDPAIDIKPLLNTKKLRSLFLRKAAASTFPLTQELSHFLNDVDLLDDHYRTPEAHKTGRLLPLLHNGSYNSVLNELLSYSNGSNLIFAKTLDYLRATFIDAGSLEDKATTIT